MKKDKTQSGFAPSTPIDDAHDIESLPSFLALDLQKRRVSGHRRRKALRYNLLSIFSTMAIATSARPLLSRKLESGMRRTAPSVRQTAAGVRVSRIENNIPQLETSRELVDTGC